MTDTTKPDLTFFICGPNKKCEHDFSAWEDFTDEKGRVCGGSVKCVKCGRTAFAEDMWL